MKINYFSDIHLEFWAAEPPLTDAELIIAAGDIGIYDQGVKWLKSIDKPVIYVAGNHEYYSHEYHDTLKFLRKECADSNIRFLEHDVFVYGGIRFLGCTLWTDLFVAGHEYADEVGRRSNDFKRIKFGSGAFDPFKFSHLHQRSLLWLEKQLAMPFPGKTVVVTHHAPSPTSWQGSPDSVNKLAYCCNVKSMMEHYKISAWFHGHIHALCYYRVAATLVLCNSRGYSADKAVPGFDMNKTVDI
ncbi:MAG: metallophosphoesterase [Gammaproteobacteria bacterium]